MNKKEIEKKVKQALAIRLNTNIKKIKLNSYLVEDLNMDSFGSVELAFELKDKFGIEISDEDLKKIKQVKDIVKYVSNKTNKR